MGWKYIYNLRKKKGFFLSFYKVFFFVCLDKTFNGSLIRFNGCTLLSQVFTLWIIPFLLCNETTS